MTTLYYMIWVILAYLVGSIPTGFLVAKIFAKQDIREFGSKNIGATNVTRLMGKLWGVLVALIDMLKGGVFLLLASCWLDNHTLLAIIGVAAVLGHNFPLWLSFKGGKGVATTFGVVAFFDFFNPWASLLAGVAWFCVMLITGYVSIASIVAIASMIIFACYFSMPSPYIFALFFLTLLTIIRHRGNLIRIIERKEPKVGLRLFK